MTIKSWSKTHYASICGSDVHVIYDGFHNPVYLGKPEYPGHEGIGIVPIAETKEGKPNNAAIIGAGSAELFYLQHLLARGIDVMISDLNEERLAVPEKLGASRIVHEPNASIVDAALEATDRVGLDLVIEAAGFDVTCAAAAEAVRIRGTVGFFGYPQLKGLAPFPVERPFRKSLTMEWINGTQAEEGLKSFRAAVEAIKNGSIEVDYRLEAQYQVRDAPAAFEAARQQGHGKVKIGINLPGAGE